MNTHVAGTDATAPAVIAVERQSQTGFVRLARHGDARGKPAADKFPFSSNFTLGEYRVGLIDSLAEFERFARFAQKGGEMATLMSQRNHPNEKGHALVARGLVEWFQ